MALILQFESVATVALVLFILRVVYYYATKPALPDLPYSGTTNRPFSRTWARIRCVIDHQSCLNHAYETVMAMLQPYPKSETDNTLYSTQKRVKHASSRISLGTRFLYRPTASIGSSINQIIFWMLLNPRGIVFKQTTPWALSNFRKTLSTYCWCDAISRDILAASRMSWLRRLRSALTNFGAKTLRSGKKSASSKTWGI